MIIVIDGPAGSGKSSTARAVADKLQIQYLDSGALYRTVTMLYLEADRDEGRLFGLLRQKTISFRYTNQQFHVDINGKSVTDNIRTKAVNDNVSAVASIPKVRVFINDLMREVVVNDIYIAEGRDLGTAVFPEADLKFYMSADINERARRRYKERSGEHAGLTFKQVKKNIIQRDQKDSKRKQDPLKKADDAIEIDTTDLTFEQQVDKICSIVEQITNN